MIPFYTLFIAPAYKIFLQCLLLIDYYSALFFAEISKIHPEEFCKKFNLCEKMVSVSLLKTENSCSICHDVIAKVLVKLKDPDAQVGTVFCAIFCSSIFMCIYFNLPCILY